MDEKTSETIGEPRATQSVAAATGFGSIAIGLSLAGVILLLDVERLPEDTLFLLHLICSVLGATFKSYALQYLGGNR